MTGSIFLYVIHAPIRLNLEMVMGSTGLFGLIILILDIYAILMILQSSTKGGAKADLGAAGVFPATHRFDYLVLCRSR